MNSLIKTCAVICALSWSAMAMAQDAAAPQADTSDDTQVEGTATAEESAQDGLSMGTSDVGSIYVAETFADWKLRCVRSEDGKDPCQLYQLLLDGNGNAVSEISIFTVAGEGPAVGGATIITPLETLLTANLRMAVDSGNSKVYPFAYCSRKGCHARLGFAEADLAAFRKGAVATIAIVPAAAPSERVDLTLSLSGFTAGWNALVAANEAAQGE